METLMVRNRRERPPAPPSVGTGAGWAGIYALPAETPAINGEVF